MPGCEKCHCIWWLCIVINDKIFINKCYQNVCDWKIFSRHKFSVQSTLMLRTPTPKFTIISTQFIKHILYFHHKWWQINSLENKNKNKRSIWPKTGRLRYIFILKYSFNPTNIDFKYSMSCLYKWCKVRICAVPAAGQFYYPICLGLLGTIRQTLLNSPQSFTFI